MFKNQKGITLIALVITIIVLLILAGVTIAMLTGTDSAPVKANEAKQKQDIGSAKDQVMLYAQEFQTNAYDIIYVQGKSASGEAQTRGSTAKVGEIGTLVGGGIAAQTDSDLSATNVVNLSTTTLTKALNGQKVGLATIKTSNAPITGITPASTDTTDSDEVTAYIRIETTDFVTYGHIEQDGGALVWDSTIQTRTN